MRRGPVVGKVRRRLWILTPAEAPTLSDTARAQNKNNNCLSSLSTLPVIGPGSGSHVPRPDGASMSGKEISYRRIFVGQAGRL